MCVGHDSAAAAAATAAATAAVLACLFHNHIDHCPTSTPTARAVTPPMNAQRRVAPQPPHPLRGSCAPPVSHNPLFQIKLPQGFGEHAQNRGQCLLSTQTSIVGTPRRSWHGAASSRFTLCARRRWGSCPGVAYLLLRNCRWNGMAGIHRPQHLHLELHLQLQLMQGRQRRLTPAREPASPLPRLGRRACSELSRTPWSAASATKSQLLFGQVKARTDEGALRYHHRRSRSMSTNNHAPADAVCETRTGTPTGGRP